MKSPKVPDALFDDNITEAIGIFYDAENNIFIDEDGFIIWSIFDLISPNDLFMFKHNKEYMLVSHKNMPEIVVELYYPDGDDAQGNLIY